MANDTEVLDDENENDQPGPLDDEESPELYPGGPSLYAPTGAAQSIVGTPTQPRSITGLPPLVSSSTSASPVSAMPAGRPARSITGLPPLNAAPPKSITGMAPMVPTPPPDQLTPQGGNTIADVAPTASGPDLAQDTISGNVQAPQWKDYKPAHVSAGRKIAAAILGGISGLHDPNLGADVTRSIAYGPQFANYSADLGEYKGALGQGKLEEEAGQRQQTAQMDAAKIAEENAQAAALLHPQAKTDFEAWQQQNPGRPIAEWLKLMAQNKPQPQNEMQTWMSEHPGSTVDDYLKTKTNDTERPKPEAGTWEFAEDANGKPMMYNSKTGETKPAPEGIAPKGTKAKADAATQKNAEPVQAAMGYADDYLGSGAFTGSGDEALQEKFFELAKPTTGFRMTQPQMDMLRNSRSWMGSAEAHLRHMASGTWFSDDQRQQIVKTMKDLGAAKMKAIQSGGAASGSAPGTGGKTYTDADVKAASTQYGVPADQIEQSFRAKGWRKR